MDRGTQLLWVAKEVISCRHICIRHCYGLLYWKRFIQLDIVGGKSVCMLHKIPSNHHLHYYLFKEKKEKIQQTNIKMKLRPCKDHVEKYNKSVYLATYFE